jgi:hypothetical protein
MSDSYNDQIVEAQRRLHSTADMLKTRYETDAVREALHNVAEEW